MYVYIIFTYKYVFDGCSKSLRFKYSNNHFLKMNKGIFFNARLNQLHSSKSDTLVNKSHENKLK